MVHSFQSSNHSGYIKPYYALTKSHNSFAGRKTLKFQEKVQPRTFRTIPASLQREESGESHDQLFQHVIVEIPMCFV